MQTVSELVGAAGSQLKPFLPELIPALIQATGELESTKLSYLSNIFGGSQTQEAIDSARAQMAKSHFTTETVSKVSTRLKEKRTFWEWSFVRVVSSVCRRLDSGGADSEGRRPDASVGWVGHADRLCAFCFVAGSSVGQGSATLYR